MTGSFLLDGRNSANKSRYVAQAGTRAARSRSNTVHSFQERYVIEEEPSSPPSPGPRPSIRANRAVSNFDSYNRPESPAKEPRPGYLRSQTTFEGPTQVRRETNTAEMPRITRVPSDSMTIRSTKNQLRPVSLAVPHNQDLFNDPEDSAFSSSPDRSYGERSVSPATSYGSVPQRSFSGTALSQAGIGAKKGPPPPPPSRAKKPPPPPPPAKRPSLTT